MLPPVYAVRNGGLCAALMVDGYSPVESPEGAVDADGNELSWKGSSNELGVSMGVSYQMNNIGIGIGCICDVGGMLNSNILVSAPASRLISQGLLS